MKQLRLFYPQKHSNFGDMLSPIIFEKLLGYKVEYSPRFFADAIGIGSLIQTFLKPKNNIKYNTMCSIEKNLLGPLFVMGSGFIGPYGYKGYLEEFRRKMVFMAVRGKLSQQRIESIESKSYKELTLGDPGLLLSMLFEHKKVLTKYKYGLIAHRLDMEDTTINKLTDKLPNSVVINILGDFWQIVNNINECEIIVSTAMHGLIVADSFNIPNIWITVSDKIEGGTYKFNDYYSVYDVERSPVNLKTTDLNEKEIENYLERNTIPYNKINIIQEALLKTLRYME